MTPIRRVLSSRHVLAVNDLARSVRHYREVLGFVLDFAVEGWAFLSFGDFRVMLGECPDEVPAGATNNHSYFASVMVENVDEVYDELRANGADFAMAIADRPWGHREFCVRTVDGHRIVFGQEIAA